ncbi:MAG: isoprenylcysteine carboxylmethyltransferase family protein [Gemmatimonadota bacterium]|nr:isoprenylcysteine carboxylmethyltransferase family protein [Gemmatimonadota bacterium]
MKPSHRGVRIGSAWILAIAFFWLALPSPFSLRLGAVFVAFGLVVRGWAAGVVKKDRELAVSGPYAFTRNPLYLGSFLIGAGAVIAGGRPWLGLLFLAYFAWVYGSTMVRETGELEERFGDGYRRYKESVPAFLPRLTRFRPAAGQPMRGETGFSPARYLRNREYEALLGAAAGLGLLALKSAGWLGLPP